MDKKVSKVRSTAIYYLPDCETLRLHAGMTKAALAKVADVSRDTITAIEKKRPVTAAMVNSVYNALAERNEKVGPREIVITTSQSIEKGGKVKR